MDTLGTEERVEERVVSEVFFQTDVIHRPE